MSVAASRLQTVMADAVDTCIEHVGTGGLPFVGVVVDDSGDVISQFGVNRVQETGDPMAHAEIEAMRDAMAARGLDTLAGTVLLATGEPCGLCYRFAITHGVGAIHVAVDRDEVARLGFDYLASYPALGISDEARGALFRPLPAKRGTKPFIHFLQNHTSTGR